MAVIQIFVLATALSLAYRLYSRTQLKSQERRLGCEAPRRYRHWDPIFGIDLFLSTGKSIEDNTFLQNHDERYKQYGHTYEALNLGKSTIYTINPENIKTILSTKSADWGIQPLRHPNMSPFCGSGFLTMDGTEWERSRATLKPSFHKTLISDFTNLECNLRLVLDAIPKDGSTVDFQKLLFDLYLDTTTLWFFGESLGALTKKKSEHAQGFLEAFENGFKGCGMRIALGPLSFLLPKKPFIEACETTHKFANHYVEKAIQYRDPSKGNAKGDPLDRSSLLYGLAERTGDRRYLRDHIIQSFMAAQETTPALISNTIFLLSRHPEAWRKLRAETLSIGNQPLDFSSLTRLQYLQNVLKETLRLHPVFPQMNRVALRDTVLPTGGGASGKSPIFCPVGTLADHAFSSLHRSKSVYGTDADAFRPERWEGESQPTQFEYVAFGAGPRSCLGQQKALMEASYVISRISQEFQQIECRDSRPWEGKFQLTTKNANGCLVSMKPI